MSGIFEAAAGAIGGLAGAFGNYKAQKEANAINEEYSGRNARLQEDVAYNGLGIRIADAERNGISKWAVVGDGATAGQISSPDVQAAKRPDVGDAIMSALQIKQMAYATEKMKQENENLEYQLKYAKEHALPIGTQPGLEQSLLGWLDTPENRDLIVEFIKKGLAGAKGFLGESPLDAAERKIKVTTRHLKESTDKKNAQKGYSKAMKMQAKANVKASKIKPKERRKAAQSRDQGALPPGSIPSYIYRR